MLANACIKQVRTSPVSLPSLVCLLPNCIGVFEYIADVRSRSRHHQKLGPPRPAPTRFGAIRSGSVSAPDGWQSLSIGGKIDQERLCETCTVDLLADSDPQRPEDR